MKPIVCLNMIVKNEARVIERCLASVKPFIDTWVIVDTGSTDGTQDKIRKFLHDIPGALHERPWVDFSHNRNEALQLAKGDYAMIMDADDVLVADPGFTLPPLTHNLYLVDVNEPASMLNFPKMFLIDRKVAWFWEGVLHEKLNTHAPISRASIKGLKILYLRDGCRGHDPQLAEKDIAVLLRALEKEPNNSRYAFFLAQTYRRAEQWDKALQAYERRSAMGGDPEERFYSLFRAARLKEGFLFPLNAVVSSYEKAYAARPTRIEPLFYLAVYLLHNNASPQRAYAILREARSKPIPYDFYFVETWIWEWGLYLPLGDAAHRLGRLEEAKEAFHSFFAHPKVPAPARAEARAYLLRHPELSRYVP